MATINDVRQLVYNKFITDWGGTTTVDADNEEFTEPELNAWVRLTIRHVPGGQSTMGRDGNRKFERKGIVFVQVFIPVGTGTADADVLALQAQGILEGTRLSVQCWLGNSVIREVGASGKWYAMNVETELNYEEIK